MKKNIDRVNKDEDFEYGVLDQIGLVGILLLISPLLIPYLLFRYVWIKITKINL